MLEQALTIIKFQLDCKMNLTESVVMKGPERQSKGSS